MDWLESSTQLKEGIFGYARQFSSTDASTMSADATISHYRSALSGSTLDDLLLHLSSTLSRNISLGEIADSFFDIGDYSIRGIREGTHLVGQIVSIAEMERKQIGRLEKILDMPILRMGEAEMERNALFVFALSREDYEKIAGDKGIPLDIGVDGPFERYIDSTFLFGALKKLFGRDCSPKAVLKSLENVDFGFGMVHDMFLSEVERHYTWRVQNSKGDYLRMLWEAFHQFKGQYDEFVSQSRNFDVQLRARHTIPQPRFMFDKTLKLDVIPYALSFTPGNELVVMGQVSGEESLYLEVYDINSGRRNASVKTTLDPLFHGIEGMCATSFSGTLSVGSNGIVYACSRGKVETFDGGLRNIEDAVTKRMSTLPIQRGKRIQGQVDNIHMVVEENGIYYLSLVNQFSPSRGIEAAIAVIGKDNVGVSQTFSPNQLMDCGGWNITHISGDSDAQPRIAVRNGAIYFKTNSNIVKVESHESEGSRNSINIIINPNELESGCVPSTHCIDSYGRIWVATKMPGEKLTSIKAYSPDGKFLTHFYSVKPHHHLAFSSTAISPSNILAYADTIDNAVRFYELPKMERKLFRT